MDLLNLGYEARKTGLRARDGVARDKYDMEDLDEFFADSTWDPPSKTTSVHISRSTSRSPLATPTPKQPSLSNFTKRTLGVPRLRIQQKRLEDSETAELSNTPHRSEEWPNKTSKEPYIDDETNEPDADNFDLDEVQPFDPELRSNDSTGHQSFDTEARNSPRPLSISRKEGGKEAQTDTEGNNVPEERMDDELVHVDSKSDLAKDIPSTPSSEEKVMFKSNVSPAKRQLVLENLYENASEASEPEYHQTFDTDVSLESDSFSDLDANDEPSQTQGDDTLEGDNFSLQRSKELLLLPSPPPEGLRRSRRIRCKPLAFWRNERIIYSRANESEIDDYDNTLVNDIHKVPLQEIKEIVKVPEPNLHQSKRRKKNENRGKKLKQKAESKSSQEPEWFKEGKIEAQVFHDDESTSVECIAWAPDGGIFSKAVDDSKGDSAEDFQVAPLFDSENNEMAAGLLNLPANGFKSLRSTKDSTFIFYVSEGTVEVELNQSKFVAIQGCSFKVPKLNIYSLKNKSSDKVRLFFVQCNSMLL